MLSPMPWVSRFLFQEPSGMGETRHCGISGYTALASTFDKTLKEDRSLGPVRVLRYYLDRTKDLHKHKELVLISFKKDFDADISPATISSWIKKIVILCYQLLDQEGPGFASGEGSQCKSFCCVQSFPRMCLLGSDPNSLSLKVAQHLHSILFKRCGLG